MSNTSVTDKARELVERFWITSVLNWEEAKQCAMVTADEIIKVLDEISLGESGTTQIDYGQSNYREIKQEIQKL